MENIGEDLPHPIQTIPEEIRGYIFNKLPQKEALKLRLICSQWKEEVNNYFNFSIRLDQRSPFLQEILQLRITKLTIIKLTNHQIQGPHNQDPLGLIFKHPKIIQELSVTYGRSIKSKIISAENLQQLLQNLQKSLKVLWLSLRAEHLNHLFPANISYNFQNVNKINISICSEIPLPPPDTWNNCLLSQIASSQIPKLHSLDIVNWSQNITNAAVPVFKLMTKNPYGLEHLKINLRGPDGTFLPLNFHHKDLAASLKISNLKTLDLDLVPSSPKELNFWSNLISDQTNLRRVQSSERLVLSNRLLQSIVLNNCDTIVYIEVNSLNLNTGGPFDLSMFKNCPKLDNLTLRRDKNELRVNVDGDTPDLINLTELSQSISNLELTGFRILARDVLGFLNSDLVNGFERVYIYNCGVRGEVGMNSDILQKILALEHTNKFRGILVNGFNVRYPKDVQVSSLNETIVRFLGRSPYSFDMFSCPFGTGDRYDFSDCVRI